MPVKDRLSKAARTAPRAASSRKPAPKGVANVPTAPQRPLVAPHVTGGQAVGALWRWLPLQLFGAAALALIGWVGWRAADYQRHAVPGSIAIDTAGAKGTITNGLLAVKLPVAVYNGAQSPVLRVTLWVNVWACPARWSPQGDCRKVLTTSQDLPMEVAHGGQVHMSNAYQLGVAEALDGDYVRIERKVDAIKTESDIPPPDPPLPNLNSPD